MLMARLTALVGTVALAVALLAPAAAAHQRAGDTAAARADAATTQPTEVLIKPASTGGLLGAGALGVADLPGVGELTDVIEGLGVQVVSVAPGTAQRVATRLQALPTVAYAEPNAAFRVTRAPNDPGLSAQYAVEEINAVAGWERYRAAKGYGEAFPATGGATIAVMDSGVSQSHPELADKIVACRSWQPRAGLPLNLGVVLGLGSGPAGCGDSNGHGTHNAGIAAAATDNGIAMAGVGFDAQIQALRTCNVLCRFSDVAAATVYAADNGADVANFSFGSPTASRTMAEAVAYADDAGVLMVAAAGNAGVSERVSFPAAYAEVMAVSATQAGGALATFSATGPQVDVAAPGDRIVSLRPGGGLRRLSGTSQAAPHVAGLGALLMSLGANADQARQAIVDGADDLGLPPAQQGAGRIDVADSVGLLTGR
jgi:subtilisin family serine protease